MRTSATLFYRLKSNLDLHKYIFIFVGWSLLIAASFAWNIYELHNNTLLTAKTAARTNINRDISFRKWAASHGGVYIPPTQATQPNPYLKIPERDVVTTTGKALTLMNPAYMLREIQIKFGNDYIIRSRLTSLKPINPENKPDDWETKALLSFERGNKELLEVQEIDDQPYMRLMLPFTVEQGCLKCHAQQGYKLGDIRGGISTSVSLVGYKQYEQKRYYEFALSHGLIWLIGLLGQSFSYRHEHHINSRRKLAETKLELSERRASSLLELAMRAGSLDEQELLQASLERAEKLTSSTIAYAHFINDDQETLTLGIWSKNTLQTCALIHDNHYPISEAGVWADCFRQKQSVIFNDYPTLFTKKGLPSGHIVLSRIMSVPVIEDDKVRMIIGVGNKAENYDESDLRELELAANSLWSLLQRKRIELELQDYRLHLEELVETRTAELLKAKQAAESANIAKSTFIATMSHELRTPLNAVLGFSELMTRDDSITATQKDTLNIINRSGTHLLNMINDVLEISKIEAGHSELVVQACDLPNLLQDIGNMIIGQAADKRLSFALEIDTDIAQCVAVDNGKLQQVLINLLGNAIKFTQQGGVILRARTYPLASGTGVMLIIEVIDSGYGMTEDQQAKLFKPFVQLVPTRSNVSGTGLGLAISKSLIELMGGHISVSSTPGTGSTFRIELPVAIAHKNNITAVEECQTVKGIMPDQPVWRLLVVDDNTDNRLLLTTMLTAVGFQVREVENGQEAVGLFAQWQPHLILMYMRMPVLDGYKAATKIRQLTGGDSVKIIAITASAFKEQYRSIIDAGCDAVIHKPFRISEVFAVLTKMLNVKFIYEDSTSLVSSSFLGVTAEMLDALPITLRQQLHKAAQYLDIEETEAIIAQIRDIAPDVAHGLQKLAESYQFEQIIQLTKSG